MIVVAVTLTFDESKQAAMIAAANRVAEATHTEAGCVSYEFFADINRPGRMFLFEEWDSEAALDAHLASPHLAEFRSTLEAVGANRELKRYVVVGS